MKTAAHIALFRVVLAIAMMASCHVLRAATPATSEAAPSTEGMSEEAMKQVAELDKYDPWDSRRADRYFHNQSPTNHAR